jgi:hypothetical protein
MKAMTVLALVFLTLAGVAFFAIPFHLLGEVIASMFVCGVFASLVGLLSIIHFEK